MVFLRDCFKDSGKVFDKVKTPEETLSWVKERFENVGVDILQKTVRIDKGRLDIPVYISRYSAEAMRLTGNPKQMGKGATAAQAEASAVMELVERYSLFSFLKENKRKSFTRKEVEADAIPVEEMIKALHSDRDLTEDFSRASSIIEQIPLEWVEGFRPIDGKNVLLPWSWFWPINEYNGSAAGNSIEEAAVQALSEVVERHVCSLISYDRLSTPTIDPESVRNPIARELLEKFSRQGIELVLKDFSLGMGVPTVGAIAWDPSTYPKRSEIVYAAGTAPDPERALIRAVTEVAQLAGDFDTDGEYVESGLPKFATLEEAHYVLDGSKVVPIESLPNCGSDNFRDEVENICNALSSSGLNGYLVDITHPVLGIPAVYAVIPGNHFRDRTRNIDVVFHCARIASGLDDGEKALAILENIYSMTPRFDTAFYIGHVLERLQRYDVALEWYERALDLGPDSNEVASIHCHRGLCFKEMEDFDQALSELERSMQLNPSLKEVHNLMGYCFYRKGDYVKAIEAFERAIAIDPSSAIDYANIGSNLKKLGLNEAAIKWYEMALELDPGLMWVHDQMAEAQKSCNC